MMLTAMIVTSTIMAVMSLTTIRAVWNHLRLQVKDILLGLQRIVHRHLWAMKCPLARTTEEYMRIMGKMSNSHEGSIIFTIDPCGGSDSL